MSENRINSRFRRNGFDLSRNLRTASGCFITVVGTGEYEGQDCMFARIKDYADSAVIREEWWGAFDVNGLCLGRSEHAKGMHRLIQNCVGESVFCGPYIAQQYGSPIPTSPPSAVDEKVSNKASAEAAAPPEKPAQTSDKPQTADARKGALGLGETIYFHLGDQWSLLSDLLKQASATREDVQFRMLQEAERAVDWEDRYARAEQLVIESIRPYLPSGAHVNISKVAANKLRQAVDVQGPFRLFFRSRQAQPSIAYVESFSRVNDGYNIIQGEINGSFAR